MPDWKSKDEEWFDVTHLYDDEIKKLNPLERFALSFGKEIGSFVAMYGKGGLIERIWKNQTKK